MKILVVEDQPQMRANITLMLQLNGYEAVSAEHGRKGVEMALAELPDLILCDVMMPELDGHGVLAELRADPDTAGIPFIFLTAKGAKRDLRDGMNLGADDYLSKPVLEADLLAAVGARLRRLKEIRQRMQEGFAPKFDSPEPLRALGLTEREAEVLLWVAQGKSSPDIAVILGMCDATAKKHVCNILAKLGLESRQAAMFTALEVLCQPRH
jgi:DNA-binding NarL/FixJ family response regulator